MKSSKKALKEYSARAIPSKLLLKRFIEKHMQTGKIKNFKESKIQAKVKRITNCRQIVYSTHKKDNKWVDLGIAASADFIISIDPDVLNLPSNPVNDHRVYPTSPLEYVRQRIPNII